MLLHLLLFLSVAAACTVDTDCGSADNTQPGLCVAGVCQCGFGYAGATLIDPASCALSCTPAALPDAVAFLTEPSVTVAAEAGSLTLGVDLAPYAKQTPATMALLHPVNGSRCSLMADELGLGRWEQSVEPAQCRQQYVYRRAFADAVSQECWESGAPTTEPGSQ